MFFLIEVVTGYIIACLKFSSITNKAGGFCSPTLLTSNYLLSLLVLRLRVAFLGAVMSSQMATRLPARTNLGRYVSSA